VARGALDAVVAARVLEEIARFLEGDPGAMMAVAALTSGGSPQERMVARFRPLDDAKTAEVQRAGRLSAFPYNDP
jgi:hypothetical protein